MILNKLDIMLCWAFANSDGPFNIKVSYADHNEWSVSSKLEIGNLSDLDSVSQIEIIDIRLERRWRERTNSSDRRIK